MELDDVRKGLLKSLQIAAMALCVLVIANMAIDEANRTPTVCTR